MGISPLDAKRMSLWEIAVVSDRWAEAHDTEDPERKGRLDESEKDEIWAWMKSLPPTSLTLKEAMEKRDGSNGTGKRPPAAGRRNSHGGARRA